VLLLITALVTTGKSGVFFVIFGILLTNWLSSLPLATTCNSIEALLSPPRDDDVRSDNSRFLLPNPFIYLKPWGPLYDRPARQFLLSRPGSNTKLSDYPSTQPLGETFVILHQYCIISPNRLCVVSQKGDPGGEMIEFPRL
jgi:hypothetical protein